MRQDVCVLLHLHQQNSVVVHGASVLHAKGDLPVPPDRARHVLGDAALPPEGHGGQLFLGTGGDPEDHGSEDGKLEADSTPPPMEMEAPWKQPREIER